MQIFDSIKKKTIEMNDRMANLSLRHNHLSEGGRYCRVNEIPRFMDLQELPQSPGPTNSETSKDSTKPLGDGIDEVVDDPEPLDVRIKRIKKKDDLVALAASETGQPAEKFEAMTMAEIEDALLGK